MSHQSVLTTYLGAFVDELSLSGIHDVVISPGSRSTPIAMMMAENPKLKVWLNLDERSAAFFALGMAKVQRKPVALLCTSGTAVANYFPAIVEANISRVPLVVITADRPHELRDVGAPQAIDQIKIYGDYVKWFVEMPLPNEDQLAINHVRTSAGRAIAVAKSEPSGPVHLNFPLQEPLIPDLSMDNLWSHGRHEKKSQYVSLLEGTPTLSQYQLEQLATELSQVDKGLIVVGPQFDDRLREAVIELANKLRFPILADPLSQLRSGQHDKSWIIDNYDSFLKDSNQVGKLQPDVIIRIGAMPISKPFLLYLKQFPTTRYIVIDEGTGWREPTQLGTEMIYADPVQFCVNLSQTISSNRGDTSWSKLWQTLNQKTKEIVTARLEKEEPFEGQVIRELQTLLPNEATIFVGNSMPVRDLDSYYFNNQKNHRTIANRGANGIDGVISSALGTAASVDDPVVLVIGDLSFYHDMNGLMAAKMHHINLNIVLINNNGGGIFSFLPQAKSPKHFEALFGTPTELNFSLATELYQGSYSKAENWQDFRQKFNNALKHEGLDVIEVVTNRQINTDIHRSIWSDVSNALTEADLL